MSWFPLFTNLKDKDCLIVGGGEVAVRKATLLLPFSPRLRIIAPVMDDRLLATPAQLICRPVTEQDVLGAALVVDATGNQTVGNMLSEICARERIPLNVVDQPDLCTVIFPAVLRRGPLVAGISTGGSSPLAAAWVRDQLEQVLPDGFEEILAQMEQLRHRAKQAIPEQPRRAALLRRVFSICLERGKPLPPDQLETFLQSGSEETT